MRRAIVHIGLPRTGTTSFQRLLDRHRAALSDQSILYPALDLPGEEPHLSHQALGEALVGRRPRTQRRELLALLERQLGAHDTVLLSYESLCLIPWWRRAPARLAKLFAAHGYTMEVLATVKPQAELLNSTYTWRLQFLRERRDFKSFFAAEVGSAKLDMARMVERWLPAAGKRLTLVPVRDRRYDAPLAARLFDAIGAPAILQPEDVAVVENPSPGPLALAIDRHLARQGGRRGAGARVVTRAVEMAVRARGLDQVRFNGLDRSLREKATARWRVSNDRLAQRAWGIDWASRVAEEPACPVNMCRADDMDAATRAAFEKILREVATGPANFLNSLEDAWWS